VFTSISNHLKSVNIFFLNVSLYTVEVIINSKYFYDVPSQNLYLSISFNTTTEFNSRILLCKPCKLYQSLFSKYFVTLRCNFSTL